MGACDWHINLHAFRVEWISLRRCWIEGVHLFDSIFFVGDTSVVCKTHMCIHFVSHSTSYFALATEVPSTCVCIPEWWFLWINNVTTFIDTCNQMSLPAENISLCISTSMWLILATSKFILKISLTMKMLILCTSIWFQFDSPEYYFNVWKILH